MKNRPFVATCGALALALLSVAHLSAQRINAGIGLHATAAEPLRVMPLNTYASDSHMSSGETGALIGLGIGIVAATVYGLSLHEHNPGRIVLAGIVIGVPCAVIGALIAGHGRTPGP